MKRIFLIFIASVGSILLILGPLSSTTNAASYSKSNQISDGVFYNNESMSPAQIQNFINAFPNSCLRQSNYPSGLPSITFKKPLDYFNYSTSNDSPADIIYLSSQYYHLNPQVILTTLEKEQNLVTGSSGCAVWKYNSAMGYNCTESGSQKDYPNSGIYNTCVGREIDAGFARQVNHAAWQLSFDGKRANGDLTWMDDGATQYNGRMTKGYRARVQGGSSVYYDGYTTIDGQSVYLDNGPTAALYNYTPHFTSFDTIFTQWFGSTNYTVYGAIATKYDSLGGNEGFLGLPQSNEVSASSGVYQRFEGGRIYWSSGTDAWSTHGGIQTKYLALGGNGSFLGLPTSEEVAVTGGVYQQFQGGRIYWSSGTGAWSTHGGIQTKYLALGGNGSFLGLPTSEEVAVTGGVYQQFQGGRIYWSIKTGAATVTGDMLSYYKNQADNTSTLGYPLGDQTVSEGNTYQQFQNNDVYILSDASVQTTHGGIRSRYLAINGASGSLGYPTSGEVALSGGVYQQFQNGRIYWSSGTKAWDVSGVMEDFFATVDYTDGYLGFPKAAAVTSAGVSSQQFQGGSIYYTNSNTYATHGGINKGYDSLGGNGSFLGYPTSNEIALTGGGRYQQFQNGRIYWSSGTGAWSTHGGIQTKYLALGGNGSFLGLPTSNEIALTGGGRYQQFQNGRIYWSSGTGAWSTHGGIQTKYLALGGNGSFLGLPTSEEVAVTGGVYQQFQGGRIYWVDSKTTVSYEE